MAVEAISALTALGAAPATGDLLVLVDISDTSQSVNGTTKRMTVANLFTGPTFTGLTTASGGLAIAGGSAAAGRIYTTATDGTIIFSAAGSANDFILTNSAGASVISVPTGTLTAQHFGLLLTVASASGTSGLRLPHGAAPSSPVNGDVWTTTAGIFVRVNGATVGPLS